MKQQLGVTPPIYMLTHWPSPRSPVPSSTLPGVTSSPAHKRPWLPVLRRSPLSPLADSPARIRVRFFSVMGSSCSQHSVLISSKLQP